VGFLGQIIPAINERFSMPYFNILSKQFISFHLSAQKFNTRIIIFITSLVEKSRSKANLDS
jgi:hypothetical protein